MVLYKALVSLYHAYILFSAPCHTISILTRTFLFSEIGGVRNPRALVLRVVDVVTGAQRGNRSRGSRSDGHIPVQGERRGTWVGCASGQVNGSLSPPDQEGGIRKGNLYVCSVLFRSIRSSVTIWQINQSIPHLPLSVSFMCVCMPFFNSNRYRQCSPS